MLWVITSHWEEIGTPIMSIHFWPNSVFYLPLTCLPLGFADEFWSSCHVEKPM